MVIQRYALIATEGPHDQAAIGKILEMSGLVKFNGEYRLLDPFWGKFVTTYPSPNQKVYTRIEVPSIYYSEQYSIAIFQGGGSSLRKRLKATLTNNPQYHEDIYAFGVVVDTDEGQPIDITRRLSNELKMFFPNIPDIPGHVSENNPRTGIYVLPDNKTPGTLDSILIKCADYSYPDHKAGATKYLSELNNEHKAHWGPFGFEKSLVATITSVLLPGLTNTASIAQQTWICEASLSSVVELDSLSRFLRNLLTL